jgi:hypothetical protein
VHGTMESGNGPRDRATRTRMVGTELKMAEKGSAADEVLAHSEDEGEWEEEPAQIESRPSGTQVISARLPSVLAEALLAEAQRLRVRPSELVREAVERWLTAKPSGMLDIRASAGQNMRIVAPTSESRSENFNLFVQVEASPDRVEVVEALA